VYAFIFSYPNYYLKQKKKKFRIFFFNFKK
jgi:hypothetical protein